MGEPQEGVTTEQILRSHGFAALADFDRSQLLGLLVSDAHDRVENVGGVLRATERNEGITLDLRLDRVNVIVENGRIIEE